jgi:hypothetical protein
LAGVGELPAVDELLVLGVVELSWVLAAAPLVPCAPELVSPVPEVAALVELFVVPAGLAVSPEVELLYVPGCWAVPFGLFAFEWVPLLLLYWLFELSVVEPVVPVLVPALVVPLRLPLLYWLPSLAPAAVEDWVLEPFETEP